MRPITPAEIEALGISPEDAESVSRKAEELFEGFKQYIMDTRLAEQLTHAETFAMAEVTARADTALSDKKIDIRTALLLTAQFGMYLAYKRKGEL